MNVNEAQESKAARALRSILEALEGRRAEWFLPILLALGMRPVPPVWKAA